MKKRIIVWITTIVVLGFSLVLGFLGNSHAADLSRSTAAKLIKETLDKKIYHDFMLRGREGGFFVKVLPPWPDQSDYAKPFLDALQNAGLATVALAKTVPPRGFGTEEYYQVSFTSQAKPHILRAYP